MSQTRINGVLVEITPPYAVGHTVNEAEAGALNQIFCENIGNNLRPTVKKLMENIEPGADLPEPLATQIQAAVDEYAAKYEITAAGARLGASPVDPVQKLAKKIATDTLITQLRAKGRKKSDFEAEAWQTLVNKAMEHPKIQALAVKRHKESQALADLGLASEGDAGEQEAA